MFFRYKIHFPSLEVYDNLNYLGFDIDDDIGGLDIYHNRNSNQKIELKIVGVSFHSPSEHIIDGKQFPVEMQVIHTVVNSKGKEINSSKVIISVFWAESNETNPEIDSFNLKDHKSFKRFYMNELLGKIASEGYLYEGSLTIPDCSKATWILLSKPLNVSKIQILDVQFSHNNSYRVLQNSENRTIYKLQIKSSIQGEYYSVYFVIGLASLFVIMFYFGMITHRNKEKQLLL